MPARLLRTTLAMAQIASVLADDGLVEFVFHRQQPLRLVGADAHEGDAGHLVDDFTNDLGIDDAVDLLGLVRAIPW